MRLKVYKTHFCVKVMSLVEVMWAKDNMNSLSTWLSQKQSVVPRGKNCSNLPRWSFPSPCPKSHSKSLFSFLACCLEHKNKSLLSLTLKDMATQHKNKCFFLYTSRTLSNTSLPFWNPDEGPNRLRGNREEDFVFKCSDYLWLETLSTS